jgi:hypothetical protein
MRAFIDQIDLAQSTNLPITICRDKIYKHKYNPFNNTKSSAEAAMRFMDNTRANNASSNETQQSHCAEVAKRNSAVTPKGGSKAQVAQHSKKACRSGGAADSTKRNVTNMGMFFLHKLDMKAVEIFPKDMPKTVCTNFMCKGRECTGKIVHSSTQGRLANSRRRQSMPLATTSYRKELVGSMFGIS